MSGHPKFIGLTLTPSGGMLGAWEDGSVARWFPETGVWVAIPSPDYEALFCTTTKCETGSDVSLREAFERGAVWGAKNYIFSVEHQSRLAKEQSVREYPSNFQPEGEVVATHRFGSPGWVDVRVVSAADTLNLELAPDVGVDD